MEQEQEVVYVSVDFEALGEGYRAINVGMVAAKKDGVRIARFETNIALPPEEVPDPQTVDWFLTENARAYVRCTSDPKVSPSDATAAMVVFLKSMERHGKVVLVFYPTIYDGTTLRNYWTRYNAHERFPYAAIDIRSFASGKLGIPLTEASIRKGLSPFMPPSDQFPHTHCGIDDAEEQLELFLNILKWVPAQQEK